MTEETPEESEKPVISRKRKIIGLIFVIGFWIFFYWVSDSKDPLPPSKTSSELQNKSGLAKP